MFLCVLLKIEMFFCKYATVLSCHNNENYLCRQKSTSQKMHDRQLSGAYYKRPCLLPDLSFADRKLRILIQQCYPLYLIMLEGHMAA